MKAFAITMLLLFVVSMTFDLFEIWMDTSYDPGTEHASSSVAEAQQRNTLIKKLRLAKTAFKVAGATGKIKEAWVEKSWGYLPHGLPYRLRDIHPTTLMGGKMLGVKFSGDAAQKAFLDWEFSTRRRSEGGEFNQGNQAIWLKPDQPVRQALHSAALTGN